MTLSDRDLYLLSHCAISAAFQAGRIINEYASKEVNVGTKDCGDSLASQVVTEVDRLCEKTILACLQPSCHIYNLALLSEESPDDRNRLQKDHFWSVDPLDGTLAFVQGKPGYAVSIALVSREAVPQIGVIFDPVGQTLYHAVKQTGAFRNGEPFRAQSVPPSKTQTFTFFTDTSFADHPLYDAVIYELETLAENLGYSGLTTLLQGGGAMNACQALERGAACYFKLPKTGAGGGSLWDYAATACIYHEAGGSASDIFGQPLELNRSEATFMGHRGVLYASESLIAEQIIALNARLQTG